MGFELGGPFAYEAKSLIVALLDQISIEHLTVFYLSVLLKLTCSLPGRAFKINLYCVPSGRCCKMFVVFYILLTLCSKEMSY